MRHQSIHKCTIVGPIGMLTLYSFSSIPSFFLFLFNSPCLFLSCPFPSSILLFPSVLMSIYSFSKLYFYWLQTHAQFHRGAHRNSVCSRVFIGVSLRACIYVYERLMCTLFKKSICCSIIHFEMLQWWNSILCGIFCIVLLLYCVEFLL